MVDTSEWKESDFMMMHQDNPTERVNAEYVSDIDKYKQELFSPCQKDQSLKLLKKFAKKDFSTFWKESVCEYLPAVAEGMMKLTEKVYTHDEAIRYAKNLIAKLDPKDLARDFLYGVSHNAPEYRTALACYFYVKNLPEHGFEKKFLGTTEKGDIYSKDTCEICMYNSKLSDEPKLQFWHINMYMYWFYYLAAIPLYFKLNTAINYLDEYLTLPKPASSKDDLIFFNQLIKFIESLSESTTPEKLRNELKQSNLLKMTVEQIDSLIDMLGYLNILHTDDSFGVIVGHTKERDMLDPISENTHFAYPVNRWTRKCGIDYDIIKQLFGDLY